MLKPGKYKHYKGGEYVVVCTALDDATKEIVVVYYNLAHGTYRTRFMSYFTEKVGDVPRFTLIEEKQ